MQESTKINQTAANDSMCSPTLPTGECALFCEEANAFPQHHLKLIIGILLIQCWSFCFFFFLWMALWPTALSWISQLCLADVTPGTDSCWLHRQGSPSLCIHLFWWGFVEPVCKDFGRFFLEKVQSRAERAHWHNMVIQGFVEAMEVRRRVPEESAWAVHSWTSWSSASWQELKTVPVLCILAIHLYGALRVQTVCFS